MSHFTQRRYTIEMASRWGHFNGFTNDPSVSASVFHYGEFGRLEFAVMQQFLKPGGFVLDIGANVGAFSVAMAHAVGDGGVVMAFEPQSACYSGIHANSFRNSLLHIIKPFHVAVGAKNGSVNVPSFPIDAKIYNAGGMSLLDSHDGSHEVVPVITVDQLGLPRCDFIKIDVEGMEPDVLDGAADTIEKFKPPIMLEQLDSRPGTKEACVLRIRQINYKAWKTWVPLHDPDNGRLVGDHIFKNQHDQIIVAVPQDAPDPKLPEMNERLV